MRIQILMTMMTMFLLAGCATLFPEAKHDTRDVVLGGKVVELADCNTRPEGNERDKCLLARAALETMALKEENGALKAANEDLEEKATVVEKESERPSAIAVALGNAQLRAKAKALKRYAATTNCPQPGTAGVLRHKGMKGVAGSDAMVCVFIGGKPVSVAIGGDFTEIAADLNGDGNIDGVYDCAPATADTVCVRNVRPGDVVDFTYVIPASDEPTVYEGRLFPQGYYAGTTACKNYGYLRPDAMSVVAHLSSCGPIR